MADEILATVPVLRFAPSPNGALHLGHAYSALINERIAAEINGRVLLRIEDFSASQVDVAAAVRRQFDVALVFSTKYQPPHPMLENWDGWQRVKEKFFGYHRDLLPAEIAQRLGGTINYHQEEDGQWVAVIAMQDGLDDR